MESLREVEKWKAEQTEESQMYHEEARRMNEDHQSYLEVYYVYQNLLSDPAGPAARPLAFPPVVTPPGLTPPAPAATVIPPRLPALFDIADDDPNMPKTKEADKVAVPIYPSITSVLHWQTALTQAIVQASGHRNLQLIIKWITDVWAVDATFESFAKSGGD